MENQPNQILKQDDFDLVCALLYLHWVLLISYTCDPVCGPLSTQVLGWLMIKFVDDPDNTGTNLGPGEWKFKSVENCNWSEILYFGEKKPSILPHQYFVVSYLKVSNENGPIMFYVRAS